MMTEEAGEFAGISYIECNDAVIARLDQLSTLLDVRDYQHSYPYAERDGKPVIFRATEQWFVSIDELDLRKKMLAEISNVKWIPETGEARIRAMIGNRPDWCISRQRPWGVGIPVFYGAKTGQPVLDVKVIERVAVLIENEGSDAWFTKSAEQILPQGYVHPDTGETEFRKETDVFDVWFDSGSTSLCVLEGNVDPAWKQPWPADLYLEGSDQHRGWFNSSLIIGTACRGGAPYKAVLTHGFLLDEEGRKMSKRLMNSVCGQIGADILRLWCASVDYTNDVACGENILKQFGESYRVIRNTMRFLLSNLEGFEGGEATEEVDIWVVEQTDLLVADCLNRYTEYDFAGVAAAIGNFCKKQLSAFYLDATKDRMYCDGRDWPSRRSAQAACHYTLTRLVKLVAPIIPHTAEEVYERIPAITRFASVHLEVLDMPSDDRLEDIEGNAIQTKFAALTEYRAGLYALFEPWKATSQVKDGQDVFVSVHERADIVDLLRSFGNELPNYLKMSWVEITEGDGTVEFRTSDFLKCDRCRLRRPDVVQVEEICLCQRCRKVVGV
jgi:isoleucyl-tRNA synthetase